MKESAEPKSEEIVALAIEKYQSMLLKYAYSIIGDYTTSQDVVQDVFLKLCEADYRKVETFLKAWLFKVCRNRAFEILRKERKMEELTDVKLKMTGSDDPTPYEEMEKNEDFKLINDILKKLPEREREIVCLKYQSNMSYREISKVADISVSNVGFILHSAIKRLRAEIL